jgi:hypothetical protein
VILVSVTVSSNLPVSAAKPGAEIQTRTGAAAMPMTVTTNSASDRMQAT